MLVALYVYKKKKKHTMAYSALISILTGSSNVQVVFQSLAVVQPTVAVGPAFSTPHRARGVCGKTFGNDYTFNILLCIPVGRPFNFSNAVAW